MVSVVLVMQVGTPIPGLSTGRSSRVAVDVILVLQVCVKGAYYLGLAIVSLGYEVCQSTQMLTSLASRRNEEDPQGS